MTELDLIRTRIVRSALARVRGLGTEPAWREAWLCFREATAYMELPFDTVTDARVRFTEALLAGKTPDDTLTEELERLWTTT